MTAPYTFSVVVTTTGEPRVYDAVRAVGEQTALPEQVVVVADGPLRADTEADVREALPEAVELTVVDIDGRRGSSTARNVGRTVSHGDVVLFIDDDTYLGPEYLADLAERYREYDAPDLAGIGGASVRDAPPRSWLRRAYHRVFYQGGAFRINEAGMTQAAREYDEPAVVDWLIGNNMSYKRSVLVDHPFSQWHDGREPLDDVGLGWGLKRAGYHCVFDPSLPLEHGHEGSGSQASALRREGRNRSRLFRRYGAEGRFPLFVWAMLGATLGLFLGESPLLFRDPVEYLRRGTAFGLGWLEGLSPRAAVEPAR